MWRGLHEHRRTVGRGDRGYAGEANARRFGSADRQQQRNRQAMKHEADQQGSPHFRRSAKAANRSRSTGSRRAASRPATSRAESRRCALMSRSR